MARPRPHGRPAREPAASYALAAMICAALVGCAPASPGASSGGPRSPDPGTGTRGLYRGPLPDIVVEGLDGSVKSLRDLVKGKVAVLDLWATWCGACHEVTARTVELANSTDRESLVVLGIDQGEERSTVARYVDGTALPYPIYIDHEFELADGVGSDRLPTIIVVDAQGNVRTVAHKLDGRVLDLLAELLPANGGAKDGDADANASSGEITRAGER